MSLVRTKNNGSPVDPSFVYSLDPLDPRLDAGSIDSPSAYELNLLLYGVGEEGYEGLILRQGDKWLKVKPKNTADVFVIGFQWGTGKHSGKMGALITKYGKVGTGFSDADRLWWSMMYELHGLPWLTKQLIEVEYMEMTPYNKFRHPRFIRIREDKTEESV
jgi:ATP-dependent DNA ligase